MKKCIRCESDRILEIGGKTSDCYGHAYKDKEYTGYVPDNVGIGGDDYIEFSYCLECGQIQGKFPVADPDVEYDDTNPIGYSGE